VPVAFLVSDEKKKGRERRACGRWNSGLAFGNLGEEEASQAYPMIAGGEGEKKKKEGKKRGMCGIFITLTRCR